MRELKVTYENLRFEPSLQTFVPSSEDKGYRIGDYFEGREIVDIKSYDHGVWLCFE